MSKLAERIYGRLFGKKNVAKRRYAAAQISRTNKDWTATPYGANWTLYRDLRILRARARDMARNAPHFRKYLKMARRNVIGHCGIQLQCNAVLGTNKTKRPNTKLNSMVEEAFSLWSYKENCTVSGKMSFTSAQKLFITHFLRDGEVLVEHVAADNGFGYALKFWNVDWLDETYNLELEGGRRIIMSVEVDENYRPLAYWLTTPASEINFSNRQARIRTRIPAEQMTHAFAVDEDESQTRGVTEFAAVLLQGKDLHEYTGGVVQSARVQSHVFGFIEDTVPDEVEWEGGEDGEGKPKQLEIDVSPLSINQLNPGQKFTQLDPKQPTQNHSEFKKSMALDIGAGLDVPGFSLTGDMSAVNYSSARVGLGEERDGWRDLQTVVSEFCRDVYHRWLLAAVQSGKLQISAKDFEQLQNPNWKPRGWRYVDPQKEVAANLGAIAGNLATYRSTLADQGVDLEEFLNEKQAEMELFKQYDIEYMPVVPKGTVPSPDPSEDATKEPASTDGTDTTDGTTDGTKPKRQLMNGHSLEHLEVEQ